MTEARTDLAPSIARLVRDLPRAIVGSLCRDLRTRRPGLRAEELRAVLEEHLPRKCRPLARRVVEAWAYAGDPHCPVALAVAFDSASLADESRRLEQQLELVWSGPAPPASMLRRTEQALVHLIDSATRDVWIVSFAAYEVPEIRRAMEAALARGVQLSLLLESRDSSGGKIRFDGVQAFRSVVAAGARVFEWPLDRRKRNEGGEWGTLHAKCSVADGEVLFVSSANLTGHAFDLNMELGLLITGGPHPRAVTDHLIWLVESGNVAPLGG